MEDLFGSHLGLHKYCTQMRVPPGMGSIWRVGAVCRVHYSGCDSMTLSVGYDLGGHVRNDLSGRWI